MTKREQIEEIAHLFCGYCKNGICEFDLKECDMKCGWARIAEKIYNAGYRKIDDACAVITKDELKQYKVQAVKEFAEKLKSRKFDKDMFNDWAGATYVVLVRDIDELLKEFVEKE